MTTKYKLFFLCFFIFSISFAGGRDSLVIKIPSISSLEFSLGMNLNQLFPDSEDFDGYSGMLIKPSVFEFNLAFSLLDNLNLGASLSIGQTKFKGGGGSEENQSEYEITDAFSGAGIGAYLQAKNFKVGLLISQINSEYEQNFKSSSYEDVSEDFSILTISPYIGAEIQFANNKLGLEMRNYFDFNYYDLDQNDFETSLTQQIIYLKFYF